jgi:hypothetical protein
VAGILHRVIVGHAPLASRGAVMRLIFETDDPDLDLFLAAFSGLLNTADNEEGIMISAELVRGES